MYNGRLFAVSMQVFLQKAPRSGEQTAAEATTEARAPRAWRPLGACCTPLLRLGDTPLGSTAPASARAKAMSGYAGREGHDGAGQEDRPRLRRHRPPVADCCSLALLICLCEFLSAQIQVSRGARRWAGRPRLRHHRPPVAGCCPLALPMCLYEFLSAQIQPSHRAPH